MKTIVVAAAVGVALLLGAAVGYEAWVQLVSGPPTSVPSCSWPLRVHGTATREQAGLVRCYLRALAQRDSAGLLAVANPANGTVRITARDFAPSADARSGTATATFKSVPDIDIYEVMLVFANGQRESLVMEYANPASAHSWRLDIGTLAGPEGPPPAKRSP